MEISKEEIRQFISEAGVLTLCAGRWYKAHSPMAMHDEDVSYSTEDFAILDFRLPHLLPELVKIADKQLKDIKADDNKVVYASMLRDTVEYWESDSFLVNTIGRRVYYKSLTNIDESLVEKKGHLRVFGYMYDIVEFETQDCLCISYVRTTPPKFEWVTHRWLDETYPGWDKRLEICRTLGYENPDMMRMALSKDPAVQNSITLSGLNLSPD